MSEVVTFIPDAGGSIVINGKCFFIKISLISGISDTKIGLKSGNLFTDFLQYTGNFKTKNEILNSTTPFGGGIYSRTVKVYSFI